MNEWKEEKKNAMKTIIKSLNLKTAREPEKWREEKFGFEI